jgi:Type II secretion system (T2SS), protein M
VSISDRDRKILMVIVPIVALAAYWFLLLSPKREEADTAGQALAKQEQARDQAVQRVSQLENAKSSFSTDYATMVRLGKAVPSNVDMPSLIVQLDAAARGTGIRFQGVAAGERSAAPAPAPSSSGSGGNGGNAAAGGAPAGTPGGKAVESANNTKAAGDKDAASKSGVDATTSTSSKQGGVPVGGGSSSGSAAAGGAACEPGLECVPLDFEFQGSFFDLSDFFHSMKRFVKVANERVNVGGRLMTVDSFKFTTEEDSFPKLKAEVSATVYLSPKKEGATAGASPQGPSATTPAGASGTPSASPGAPPTTPTATATP